MYRAIPVGNRLCETRNQERKQQQHREKIRTMKSSIDTTEPHVLRLDHIRNNLKREQLLEERYGEIDRENRILLQKMSDIMRNPQGDIKKSMSTGTTGKGPGRGPISLNKDYRKKELLRITQENQAILKRIQRAQPMYNHVKWEESHKRNQEYLRNCCEYPLVLRRSMGSLGNPDGVDSLIMDQAGVGKLDDYGRKNDSQQDLKFVLKEGKKIGESYYLVEMSTDGRTLTISAYDGDTQKTLELLINEKNHRRLYRECNGDYGMLANRLSVDRDRLILMEPKTMSPDGQGSGQLNADEMTQRSGKNVDVGISKDGHASTKMKR